jgi:hypothetical protein
MPLSGEDHEDEVYPAIEKPFLVLMKETEAPILSHLERKTEAS